MILLTIGSAPHDFSRLVSVMDHLAKKLQVEVVMQIGDTAYMPQNAEYFDYVPYERMIELYKRADVVVSHGSSGPFIYAQKYQKPIIIFPRSGDLGEHVDNHQLEVAKAIENASYGSVQVVYEAHDLEKALCLAMKSRRSQNGEDSLEGRAKIIRTLKALVKTVERGEEFFVPSVFATFLKRFLVDAKVYSFFSDLKNGTLKYLRTGYNPGTFWDDWGEYLWRQRFRRSIGYSHLWLAEQIREAGSVLKVLEAGCSFGRALRFLSRELPDINLIGLDLSAKMLSEAAKEKLPNVRLMCGNAEQLPFRDKEFDWSYTHGLLMHVPPGQLENCFLELVRVSQKGISLVEEIHWRQDLEHSVSLSLNSYTFIHPYLKIFQKVGWRVISKKIVHEGTSLLLCLSAVPESQPCPVKP